MTAFDDGGLSIQERLLPDGMCYGCGPANPDGLHLRSYPAPDGIATAEITIPERYENGFGVANGGVITMVLDCHTGAVVIDDLSGVDWTDHPPFLSSGLEVSLRRPTPVETPLLLTGKITERRSTEITVEAAIRGLDGKTTATLVASWRPVLRRL